jgi:predicted AlkP superfamily phosphohydrolase/phosphomutase
MAAPALTVVGLDSATIDVVRPLAEAGHLPNISRVLAGASGTLRSTTPPVTPLAWTTMATGVGAGRHGVWDFHARDETGYGLVAANGSYRRAPAVWDFLGAAGRRVGLVGIPFTWPAPAVEGFAVSGCDALPDVGTPDTVFPAELEDELVRDFPDIRIEEWSPLRQGGRIDVDGVRRSCEQKTELALRLAKEFEPDLLFVVFMAADRIHHVSWPEWEERGVESHVAEIYRILDAAVGALAPSGGDVMLVSDHGAGPLRGVVSLNGWLSQEGYLAYRPRPGLLRRRARGLARKLGRPNPAVIEWKRTSAFAYGMFGSIVLNVRGRESFGLVDEADYDPLRDEIAGKALELRDGAGNCIFSAVHRRENLFDGPELDSIPDLILEFDDYAWLGTGDPERRSEDLWDAYAMRLGARGGWLGTHRRDGLFALAGPSAVERVGISADILDIAPTILYLLDQPVPSTFEGRVLEEAVSPSVLDKRAPEYAEVNVAFADRTTKRHFDDEAIERRLRDLGYLE